MSSIIVTAAIGLAFVVGLVILVILFNFFGIWLRAKIADAPVSFARLVGMRLRRVPVGMLSLIHI